MTWQFSDRGLEKEAHRLARLVSGLALFTTMLISVGAIGGYFLSRYEDERRDSVTELTSIQMDVIRVIDAENTTADPALNWILATAARVADFEAGRHRIHFAIYDAKHTVLAESGEVPGWPSLRVERPIDASNPARGKVVVEHSLWDAIHDTVSVALIALGVSATLFFFFRSVPLRAFHQAMIRLDQAQQARSLAEGELRAHVVELERTKDALQLSADRLQSALEAAAESSEAKSQFLASMSHELRTPLNAIIGFSEIMDRGLFGEIDNLRYGEYIDLILNSARHLLTLVNEILDLSKAGAGKLDIHDDEIDLAIMVSDIFRTLQPAAAQVPVMLVSKISSQLPRLRADSQRLTQVLLNLVSNAIKFNLENGTVTVSAEHHGASGLRIEVLDTGIGIAAENIPIALERFGQIEDSLTRKYQGTGLGLPISKKLIELHGGTLMLKSALGEGTCVTVWLPPERVLAPSLDPEAVFLASAI